jgi:hypothetical protein
MSERDLHGSLNAHQGKSTRNTAFILKCFFKIKYLSDLTHGYAKDVKLAKCEGVGYNEQPTGRVLNLL